MICNNCKHEIKEENNFCMYCGAKLKWNMNENVVSSENVREMEGPYFTKEYDYAPLGIKYRPWVTDSSKFDEYEDEIVGRFEILKQYEIEHDIEIARDKALSEAIKFEAPKRNVFYKPGEYAYVRIEREIDNVVSFRAIDKISVFKKNPDEVSFYHKNYKVGDYCWVKLVALLDITDPKNYQYYADFINEEENSVWSELTSFYSVHKEGDVIYAPISVKEANSLIVKLGPITNVKVSKDTLGRSINMEEYKERKIAKFKVTKLVRGEDKKIDVSLAIVSEEEIQSSDLWNSLPASLENSNIPRNLMEIRDYADSFKIIAESIGKTSLSYYDFVNFISKKYSQMYAKHAVNVYKNRAGEINFDFETGLRSNTGAPIYAGFKISDRCIMTLLGFPSVNRTFESRVNVKSWDNLLEELAGLAKEEGWSFKNSSSDKMSILKSYFLCTFYKCYVDGVLMVVGDEAIFNTGLINSESEDIFCYLKKNTMNYASDNRPYEFGFFFTENMSKAKPIVRMFKSVYKELPSTATYIKSFTDLHLDLDTNKNFNITMDYEHLLSRHMDRIPMAFYKTVLGRYSDINKLISNAEKNPNNKARANAVYDAIRRTPEYREEIKAQLDRAIEKSKKNCIRNYRLVVPIFYARNNTISLLLPISLPTGDADKDKAVDLALVVEHYGTDGFGLYIGHTFYTLRQAYQDARLLGNIDSTWLSLDKIEGDETCTFSSVDKTNQVEEASQESIANTNDNTLCDIMGFTKKIVGDDWEYVSVIGHKISEEYPDFDYKDYGYSKLADFLEKLGLEVERRSFGNGGTVAYARIA